MHYSLGAGAGLDKELHVDERPSLDTVSGNSVVDVTQHCTPASDSSRQAYHAFFDSTSGQQKGERSSVLYTRIVLQAFAVKNDPVLQPELAILLDRLAAGLSSVELGRILADAAK